MAIERIALTKPLELKIPQRHTTRSVAETVMALHPRLLVPLRPGRYDVTPEFETVVPLVQILVVQKNGEGQLKVTPSGIKDADLARVASGNSLDDDPENLRVTRILRITRVLPVIIQTLDGFNNPTDSPVVGIFRYSPISRPKTSSPR
jgi:hypothetical protein